MTKIIWVTEGLMATTKLAEALKEMRSRECLIVKVSTVQEAICELFEGKEPASLVICDNELHRSLPKRELRQAAELRDVPYLVAALDHRHREQLLAVADTNVPLTGPLSRLMNSLQIVQAQHAELDAQSICSFA